MDRFLDLVRERVRSALGAVFHRRAALGVVHRELAREPAWFATQLECIYMSRRALRRFDPAHATYLRLDRGAGEALEIDTMDESWVVTCHVLRTRGITWDGPDPATLVDPVSRADLRAAMHGLLDGWAAHLQRWPDRLRAPNYQSYAVLSLCRILHTLHEGTICSKVEAAGWAASRLPAEWRGLIAQAVADRSRDNVLASDAAVSQTLRLVDYARSDSTP